MLTIADDDVFEVTPEGIEYLPDWLETWEPVDPPTFSEFNWIIETQFYEFSEPELGGSWGDYLVRLPDPVGITVMTPEQLKAWRGS